MVLYHSQTQCHVIKYINSKYILYNGRSRWYLEYMHWLDILSLIQFDDNMCILDTSVLLVGYSSVIYLTSSLASGQRSMDFTVSTSKREGVILIDTIEISGGFISPAFIVLTAA